MRYSAAAVPRAAQGRVGWLDGVRGVAALFVVLHHTWLAAFPHYPYNRGPWWLGWALYGHFAVAVFIVVSGFSLGMAPVRHGDRLPRGAGTFLRRRAWRILPPYWAALALSMVVVALVTGPRTGATVNARSLVVFGLLAQDVVGAPAPNGVFWSIALEWHIYFLFPLVLLVSRRFGTRWAVGGSLAAVLTVYLLSQTGPTLAKLDRLLPQFFGLFVLGVLAAKATVAPPSPALRRLLTAALGGLSVVVVGLCVVEGSAWVVDQFFWMDLLVGAATAVLLGLLAAGSAVPARAVLGSRPLLFLGLFSYSIYLVHAPLLETGWLYGIRPLGLSPLASYWALLGTVPIVLTGCYLFFRVFEAPFLTARSWADVGRMLRRGRRRAEPAAGMPVAVPPEPAIVPAE